MESCYSIVIILICSMIIFIIIYFYLKIQNKYFWSNKPSLIEIKDLIESNMLLSSNNNTLLQDTINKYSENRKSYSIPTLFDMDYIDIIEFNNYVFPIIEQLKNINNNRDDLIKNIYNKLPNAIQNANKIKYALTTVDFSEENCE